MTDKAALLRAYHYTLSDARFLYDIDSFDATFRGDHGDLPAAAAIVLDAHTARVRGQGSPASCDEALARALREIGT